MNTLKNAQTEDHQWRGDGGRGIRANAEDARDGPESLSQPVHIRGSVR